MNIYTNINLNKNEIQNVRIQNLDSAPSDLSEGLIYYNTVDKTYYGWNGTKWQDLGNGTTDYNDLINKPTIPNKTSDLTNDSNFVTTATTDNLNIEIHNVKTALNSKVDKSQVLTNVPANAVFTDTVTTINGKTGVISKSDIVALGLADQDNVYTKVEVDNKVSAVYRYRGSISTYSELPTTDLSVGDTYNVTTSGEGTDINYAWNGTTWDNIGGVEALATLTNNGLMAKEDFAKLISIEAGATKNDTDVNLKNRGNHTGTQSANTISDFSVAVRSIIYGDKKIWKGIGSEFDENGIATVTSYYRGDGRLFMSIRFTDYVDGVYQSYVVTNYSEDGVAVESENTYALPVAQ